MNKTALFATLVVLTSAAVEAGGFRFSAGLAWRSRAKLETRGVEPVATVPASTSQTDHDRNPSTRSDWTAAEVTETRPEPGGLPDDKVWAVGASFVETVVTPGESEAFVATSDTRSPLGFKANLGLDFYENETISVGLDLRFAGYWNMKASAMGTAAGATTMTHTGTDWWLFLDGPYPDDNNFGPFIPERTAETEAVAPTTWGEESYSYAPGTVVRSRLCADLYQVGLGPTVTWHAFSWLDAYASVAVLCNIASIDFEAGAASMSDTQCRLGFAGDVGLAAYLTKNIGVYAEVGYEWIDDFDASVNGFSADIDFSSIVVSAGIAFKF